MLATSYLFCHKVFLHKFASLRPHILVHLAARQGKATSNSRRIPIQRQNRRRWASNQLDHSLQEARAYGLDRRRSGARGCDLLSCKFLFSTLAAASVLMNFTI
jgi:hypothetical protein